MNILITGCASGINYDVLNRLLNKDYFVYATTHTEKQAFNLQRKLNRYSNVKIFKLDINNEKDLNKIRKLEINILISSAAIGNGGSIIDAKIGYLESNFKTNVFNNFKIIKIVLDKMLKSNSGKIIVTSSVAGVIPIPYLGIYSSTKASISMLSKVLRQELKLQNKNITVSIIEPGIYNTGFNDLMFMKAYEKSNNSFILFEKKIFKLFGKTNMKSISKKYIKCIESKHPKKKYRAPLLASILTKLYLIIFE